MTDEEVEDIIKSNMMLQMNFAGIRQDFEEKLQRTWVGLTDEELPPLAGDNGKYMELQQVRRFYKAIEAKLKEKNCA